MRCVDACWAYDPVQVRTCRTTNRHYKHKFLHRIHANSISTDGRSRYNHRLSFTATSMPNHRDQLSFAAMHYPNSQHCCVSYSYDVFAIRSMYVLCLCRTFSVQSKNNEYTVLNTHTCTITSFVRTRHSQWKMEDEKRWQNARSTKVQLRRKIDEFTRWNADTKYVVKEILQYRRTIVSDEVACVCVSV